MYQSLSFSLSRSLYIFFTVSPILFLSLSLFLIYSFTHSLFHLFSISTEIHNDRLNILSRYKALGATLLLKTILETFQARSTLEAERPPSLFLTFYYRLPSTRKTKSPCDPLPVLFYYFPDLLLQIERCLLTFFL